MKTVLVKTMFVGILCGSCIAAHAEVPQLDLGDIVAQKVKSDIASAMVLTDASLISLGIIDFDPNKLIDFGKIDAGSEASLERRKSLKSYSLPWEGSWEQVTSEWQTATAARFSYVDAHQKVALSTENAELNVQDDSSFLLFAEQKWRYQLTEHWRLVLGAGAQMVWYKNTFDFRDPFIQQFQSQLDKLLTNTSYAALMADPSVQFSYTNRLWDYKWEFISTFRYGFGQTLFTDSDTQSVSPEVGRLSNAVIMHVDLPSVWNNRNEMRLLLKRIDLSGDSVEAMGTHNYYEFGAGWIIETPSISDWIANIGIGITINVNSGLSGGGVVLLFNEEL